MSRLIDADALISAINKSTCNWAEHLWKQVVCDVINNQPTAFDTEKVVEELMIIHDEGYCPNEDGLECILNKACSDCYREKIADIVKKGGVE